MTIARLLGKVAPGLVSRSIISTQRALDRLSPAAAPLPVGLNWVGYLRGNNGLGVSARAIAAALVASDLPCSFVAIPGRADRDTQDAGVPLRDAFPYRVTAIHVNPLPLPAVLSAFRRAALPRRKLVGMWFWELERVPKSWRTLSESFDEVWTGSAWNRALFAEQLRCPVFQTPIPLDTLASAETPRGPLPLPIAALGSRFLFLSQFNAKSGLDRKNPEATIEAYRSAFPVDVGATALLMKSLNGRDAPSRLARLREAAGGRADIALLDGDLTTAQMNALYDRCDCYVSLHRSEGLGLGILEAWRRGKAVAFTDYSGPVEFRDLPGMQPVRFRRTSVETAFKPYRGGGEWAEPDLDHASEVFRRVAAGGHAPNAWREAPPAYSSPALRAFVRERVEALSAH